jgi:D-alanyl-D-alanine carboxypeptidase (penicillin-binding protein 5/6)
VTARRAISRPILAGAIAAVLMGQPAVMNPAVGQVITGKPTARQSSEQNPSPASTSSSQIIGGPRLNSAAIVVGSGKNVGAFPTVNIESFVVADDTSGRILAVKNAHQKLPPASTLKTLTALTLLPRLHLSDQYQAISQDTTADGSRVGLSAGSHYTFDQLFYAMFLPSANDAATALARARGSVAETVTQMNQEAQRLQALDTTAKNPTGLDADGQVSSAYDLALFGREGLKNPDFARYAATVRTKFPGAEPKSVKTKRSSFTIETENRLMRAGYPGMIGIKTGYTTKAQRTFIGAAQRGDKKLVISMMGNKELTAVDAKRLLDWGFANVDKITTAVGQLVDPLGPAPTYTPYATASTQSEPTLPESARPQSGPESPSPTASKAKPKLSSLKWFVVILGISFSIALALLGYVSNGALARRRIRQRYRR